MHGEGKMQYEIEQYTREGTWKEGRFDGEHTIKLANGEVRKQFWIDYELIGEEII